MKETKELLDTGTYEIFKPDKSMLVRDLLKELNLEQRWFGILVNEKKAYTSTPITPEDEVVIIPRIAGGKKEI